MRRSGSPIRLQNTRHMATGTGRAIAGGLALRRHAYLVCIHASCGKTIPSQLNARHCSTSQALLEFRTALLDLAIVQLYHPQSIGICCDSCSCTRFSLKCAICKTIAECRSIPQQRARQPLQACAENTIERGHCGQLAVAEPSATFPHRCALS
jgi:hypothetical protein